MNGHGQQLDREMVRLGRGLVVNLFVLLKTAQNYPEGHSALFAPVGNTLTTVREIHRHNEEAALRIRGGHLLLGETRLKPDAGGIESFLRILALLRRFSIGSIHFHPAVTLPEIMAFAYLVNETEAIPAAEGCFALLAARLQEKMIAAIDLEPLVEEGEQEKPDEGALARSKRMYLQTMNAVSDVMDTAKMGQTLRLRTSKRVVQSLIDQLLTAETNLLGLTTIRCHDEYTYHHSVNVCILALAIGQRIGLGKARLCELGMAALFHDLGKADVPPEILNKPTEFTAEEWDLLRSHPVLGVKRLMKLKGLDVITSRMISGSFEHHMNADFSGYPKFPYRRLSLFGRIISIVDCYDALTSSRVYSRTPYSPDGALRFLLARAGKQYDPLLLKVFVNSIGIYPLGSLLRLSTNELAVVVGNSPDPLQWDRPAVKVISDREGNEIDGEIVDLSAEDQRQILETLDPHRCGIDMGAYFV